MKNINQELKIYIEKNVLPQYESNAVGHGIEHISYVIQRSFELMESFSLDINPDMVYTIAAFHDIGYKINPEEHEKISSQIFLNDKKIQGFFTEEEIKTIGEAIIDHRASLKYEARSIYGKLVSSADREISVEKTLERSILFQSDKHKTENPSIMDVIEYSYMKLARKYGILGYAKMYYQDQKYINFINTMQDLLSRRDKFIEKELEIIGSLTFDSNTQKLVKVNR